MQFSSARVAQRKADGSREEGGMRRSGAAAAPATDRMEMNLLSGTSGVAVNFFFNSRIAL